MFHFALKSYVPNSNVMTGGNLCVYTSSKEQKELLLNATIIADWEISCNLLRSSSIFKGVIFGVPIAEKEEHILAVLSHQNVTLVKRFPIVGRPEIHSETILLTFFAFRIHPSNPNPLSCINAGSSAIPLPDANAHRIAKNVAKGTRKMSPALLVA